MKLRHALAALTLLASPVASTAADIHYRPDGSFFSCFGVFSDANCWSPSVVPGNADNAIFDAGSSYQINFAGPAASRNATARYGYATWMLNGYTYAIGEDLTIGAQGSDQGQVTAQLGVITASDLYIGKDSATSTGNLNLLLNASLRVGSLAEIGGMGTGSLNVLNHSSLTADEILVGKQESSSTTVGGDGTLLIDGAGSMVEAGRNIGIAFDHDYANRYTSHLFGSHSNGSGMVTVQAGGVLKSGGNISIGNSGTLVVDGGEVIAESLFNLGGQINHIDGDIILDGDVFSDGRQSTLTPRGYLGDDEHYGLDRFEIGSTGKNPRLILKGGAYAYVENDALVGVDGNGELQLLADAEVITRNSTIGQLGNGKVTVDGAGSAMHATTGYKSRFDVRQTLVVGGIGGEADLSVRNGASVFSRNAYIGVRPAFFFAGPGRGSVVVDGVGSTWVNSAALYVGGDDVGDGGASSLSITNGAKVSSDTLTIRAPGTLTLANATLEAGMLSNHGALEVTGAATSSIDTRVDNSGGGIGVDEGATARFKQAVTLGGGDLHIGSGGEAVFEGNVSGSANVSGSGLMTVEDDFSPGDGPGLFLTPGSLTLGATSMLHIQIGGTQAAVDYDVISIGGSLTAGGTLAVTLISDPGGNAYLPKAGDVFNLLLANVVFGDFDALSLADPGPGLTWALSRETYGYKLSVAAVPLPPAAWMLGLALLSLMRTLKRSRS